MKINWKVRIKNPVFWWSVAVAIIAPILTALGIEWQSVTSWARLWEIICEAVNNPVIVVAIAVSLYNTLVDPTTKGVSDSERALTYSKPGGKE